VNSRTLNPKTSSKSMTEVANLNAKRSFGAPMYAPNVGSDTGKVSTAAQDGTGISQHPTTLSLQPTVADASEETTPTPTPATEHVHLPFNTTEGPDVNRQAQSPPHEPVSPKQKEVLQPIQQPSPDWYPDPITQTWQTASPPQSPIVHHYGGFQNPGQIQYPYDYSYGYSPHIAPGGYQQYANPHYLAPFSPPAEAARPPSVERYRSRSGSGDEQTELLNRIQSVLPDLARLLEQSREGQAPNLATEAAIPKSQFNNNEQLVSLQQELDATKKEYERVIRNLVDENCTLKSEAEDRKQRSRSLEGDSKGSRKLKNEFEVLQAQHQDLASSVDSIRLSKEELMAEKLGVEKHIELLKKDKHIVKDSHHRAITDLKQQHLRELTTMNREHQRIAIEHKAVLSKVQLDLATLITKHTNMRKDLETARSSETAYKASAEARLKELEAAKLHHVQQSDRIKMDHQRTLESLKQEHKNQRQHHENEIKRHVTELEAFRSMEIERDNKSRSLEAELQEQKLALAAERDAHASLQSAHEQRNKRTADLVGAMTLWRQKHAELQKESENLDCVLRALGSASIATETAPEPDQPAPDSAPVPILDEKEMITPVGETLATSTFTEATQEAVGTAMPLKEELPVIPEKELLKVGEVEAILEPGQATEAPQEAETVPAANIATTSPGNGTSPSVKSENVPKESASMRTSEKVTKASVARATQAHVQAAEEPITFRPIQYYQVPGHYQ
jgi:hypothetical protein